MIDTIVVSGGNIQKDFVLDFLRKTMNLSECTKPFLIAADRGLEFFEGTEFQPDAAVGDFDSLSSEGRKFLTRYENMEIYRLKPQKDDSDTQSAVTLAIERGAREILLFGATGSRADHFLANLGLLSLGKSRGVQVVIADACNWITLIESGTVLRRENQFGNFVSFFPVGGAVRDLTLEGFKYPLNRHLLQTEDSGLTVSNEIMEETARVTFAEGTLLMIMSRD